MNNLTKFRAKHNMTQEELGRKTGTSRAAVCFIEKNRLSADKAKEFASILNENVFELLGADNFVILPQTEEDKEILISIIRGL